MTEAHGAITPEQAAAAARLAILDTDVWSALYLADTRKSTPERLELRRSLTDAVAGHSVAIALQTRAEILTFPAAKGLGAKRTQIIRDQLDATATVPVSPEVLEAWVTLTAACRLVNHPLGYKAHAMDRWIAATAIALDVPLLTLDSGFTDAPGLTLMSRRQA